MELHDDTGTDSEHNDNEEDNDDLGGEILSPKMLFQLFLHWNQAFVLLWRKIVNKFQRCPVKNDAFQKAVKMKFDKELTLQREYVCHAWMTFEVRKHCKQCLKLFQPFFTYAQQRWIGLNKRCCEMHCLVQDCYYITFLCKQDHDLAAAEKIMFCGARVEGGWQ